MAGSRRRRFGSIVKRTSRATGSIYYEARYRPPIDAYAKWPGLPKIISKNFPEGFESEAERFLLDAERLIRLGQWEPPSVTEKANLASRVTFAEYVTDYVANHHKSNGEPIEETTREKYEQYLRDYLIPVLGSKPMVAITPKDIQAWADSMKVGPSGERQSIKRKVWELLCAIFRHACETPLDEAGTTLLKRSPVLITIEKPHPKVQYVDVSMEELQTLHDAMKPRLAPLIYLMGVTGLRPEEVYGLQRRNVELKSDLSCGWLHITNAAKPHPETDPETGERHRPIRVGKTKTRLSVRDIEIPAPIAEDLDRHLKAFVPDDPEAFLFTGERNGKIINPQTVRNSWYKARVSVPRLEEKKVRLYNLRHRAASHMATYTNSDKTVMRIMGHTQLNTDLHYQHALEGESQKILQGMEADFHAARQQEIESKQNPSAQSPTDQQSPDELRNLAKDLEGMSLSVRVNVLTALDADKRSAVLSLFSPDAQVETMRELFRKAESHD